MSGKGSWPCRRDDRAGGRGSYRESARELSADMRTKLISRRAQESQMVYSPRKGMHRPLMPAPAAKQRITPK